MQKREVKQQSAISEAIIDLRECVKRIRRLVESEERKLHVEKGSSNGRRARRSSTLKAT